MWISVKEALPDPDVPVLTLLANMADQVDAYHVQAHRRGVNDDFSDADWFYWDEIDPDYWMPLPEAPAFPKDVSE